VRCLLVTSFTFSRFCFTTVCWFMSSITLNNLWADFCGIWGVSSLWTREELIKFWKLEGRIMVNDNGWHSGGGMRCTECRPVELTQIWLQVQVRRWTLATRCTTWVDCMVIHHLTGSKCYNVWNRWPLLLRLRCRSFPFLISCSDCTELEWHGRLSKSDLDF